MRSWREELEHLARGKLPKGWDTDLPSFQSRSRKAWRHANRPARCSTRLPKSIPWLLGGSADLAPSDEDQLEFDGAGTIWTGQPRRTQSAFRRARTCGWAPFVNGLALVGAATVRRNVPYLQRLMPPGDSAGRADGDAARPRVHTRFDRRRRRRADASAGRTARGIARNSRSVRCCVLPTQTKWPNPIASFELQKSAGVSGADPAGTADLRS